MRRSSHDPGASSRTYLRGGAGWRRAQRLAGYTLLTMSTLSVNPGPQTTTDTTEKAAIVETVDLVP